MLLSRYGVNPTIKELTLEEKLSLHYTSPLSVMYTVKILSS